jgi:hypothetical protein
MIGWRSLKEEKRIPLRNSKALGVVAGLISVLSLFVVSLHGQGGDMQQKMTDLKESMSKNKQALAQYTWAEQVTISVKGQQKKVEHFQVRMGADGKPQKTSLDEAPQQQQAQGGRGGRLRQRVVERKKEEYEDYADSMKELAQKYVPPDKDAIQGAYMKGNVSFTPSAGGPNEVKIDIRNYIKPNDLMTILFDKEKKQIVSIKIASYMDDPTDAMNLTVQFSSLPEGVSHVSAVTIDGVKKQLFIATQNSNYQKL